MSDEWISETEVANASLVILVGLVKPETISEEALHFPKGVLHLGSESSEKTSSSARFVNIDAPENWLREQINDFLLLDYDTAPAVKVSKILEEEYKAKYSRVIGFILQEIDTTLRARRTRDETGFFKQLQIHENLPFYLKQRIPDEWGQLCQESMVIVVGAGPSLDKTLPLISTLAIKPFIIAADSSLKALKKASILPNFVVSIDSEKRFDSCSYPGFTPGCAILSSQSNSTWSRMYKDKKAYISGRVVTEDFLAEKGIGKTSVQAINNAGLTAIQLANSMGPSAILLIGMDLSGGGNGEVRYAKNTGRDHIQIHAEAYHKIPGNFTNEVLTPFFSDWLETSQLCSKISQKRLVINFNDRGAQLDGVTLIHPDAFPEMRSALEESLKSFSPKDKTVLQQRRSLNRHGLTQILNNLTIKCDLIWKSLPSEKDETKVVSEKLLKLFSDREISCLLGDFSFSIMPKIAKGKTISQEQGLLIIKQLKQLIWKLEDAILRAEPEDDFIYRFLTEEFH